MKELDEDVLAPIEVEAEAKQPTSEVKIMSMILPNGVKLWCYNPKEGTLEQVVYKEVAVDTIDGSTRYKAMFLPGCSYVRAINTKNALRKLKLKAADTEWKKNTTSLP